MAGVWIMAIYRGVNGVNRQIKEQYRGLNGVNRKINEQWRGDNGVNRPVMKKPYVVTNALYNSSFEDTTEAYKAYGSSGMYSTGQVKYGLHSFLSYGNTYTYFNDHEYSFHQGHVVYCSCYVYIDLNSNTDEGTDKACAWIGSGGKRQPVALNYTWTKVSNHRIWEFTIDRPQRLCLNSEQGRWSEYGKQFYFDGIMAIDLTACFGVGNEPSKEWCDENINYFTGSRTLYY